MRSLTKLKKKHFFWLMTACNIIPHFSSSDLHLSKQVRKPGVCWPLIPAMSSNNLQQPSARSYSLTTIKTQVIFTSVWEIYPLLSPQNLIACVCHPHSQYPNQFLERSQFCFFRGSHKITNPYIRPSVLTAMYVINYH